MLSNHKITPTENGLLGVPFENGLLGVPFENGLLGVPLACAIEAAVWFKQHSYIHRNHKLNK